MEDFSNVKVGDILKITGAGAPGFAKLGDLVKVTAILSDPGVKVVLPNGNTAEFVYSCGAKRLEKTELADLPELLR